RERIITAARELIRETGDAGLSMRVLARRAGVSLTTPYNLFGSKRAIVVGALEQFNAPFAEAMQKLAGKDPMARLFGAGKIATQLYADDPQFYRALFVAVFDIGAREEYHSLFGPSRHAFWKALVGQARAAGQLTGDFDVDLFTSNLEQVFLSTLLRWITNEIAAEDMEAWVGYGYDLALSAVASEAARADLTKRRAAYEARLERGAGA